MKWNAATQQSTARSPQYIPATARSVSVAVNGGTPQYLNAPATTLTVDAPVGVDTFALVTYDTQNGQGNVLSRAAVTQTIALGTANVVPATLNGVIASFAVSLGNAAPNAGTPATTPVNITAKDADGNTILGPGDYSTAVHLALNDPGKSGTLSLSPTTIPNPATTATLTYSGGTLGSATVVASATGFANASATFAPTPTFQQFSLPVPSNRPWWITAGPDGNMWFTEAPGNAIARITPAGAITEFPIPTAGADPQGITAGSDGRLWFTEFVTSKIGAVTTSGVFTEFATVVANDAPLLLVGRPDGSVAYTGFAGNDVSFLTAGGFGVGSILPTASSGPYGIAIGPDGGTYFTETNAGKIGRIIGAGNPSEVTLTAGAGPLGIVLGPDGNLWFTEKGQSMIGRLSPTAFTVTGEFPTLTPGAQPTGITVGADGALWFTENGPGKIGRITTGGVVTEYASPVAGSGLGGIASAPDGSLWFTEPGSGFTPTAIGRLVY